MAPYPIGESMKNIKLLLLVISILNTLALPSQAQLYTPDKAGMADAIHDYKINSWWESIICDQLFDFQLSAGTWPKMVDKDGWGIKTISNNITAIGAYMKAKDWGDLEAAESANNSDRDNNKPRVIEMINEVKNKMHFTLNLTQVKGSDAEISLISRLYTVPFDALEDGSWKPPHGDVFLNFTFSPNAKDISVTVNPDGKHFSVTAPTLVEPSAWDEKIIKGLNRVSRPVAGK